MLTHPLLEVAARHGIRLGLDRTAAILERLGRPHRALRVVHVAGTNGKGSVVRLLAAIYRAGGYRVGEYTSPHLQRLNERVVVDGREISDADLARALAEVDRVRRAWVAEELGGEIEADRALTYFELVTAAAFTHLARAGVDLALVEVGLGGRLDATNVVDPLVSVITTVGLDHTDVLGPDLASIAAEKAGIVKPGRPVVTGPLPHDALRVVRAIAAERGAPLVAHEQAWRVRRGGDGRIVWSWHDGGPSWRGLELGLPGPHQVDNAGVALAVVRVLADRFPVPEEAVRRGLAEVRHPGRLEWLAPDVLVDCAHNGLGASRLAAALGEMPRDRPRTLLLGMSRDKDARSVVVELAPQVDRVLTTCTRHPRALSAGDLAERIGPVGVPVLPAGRVEEALAEARDGRSLVVVAGSVFLAGAVRDLLGTR